VVLAAEVAEQAAAAEIATTRIGIAEEAVAAKVVAAVAKVVVARGNLACTIYSVRRLI
jgi:hypothetical protein